MGRFIVFLKETPAATGHSQTLTRQRANADGITAGSKSMEIGRGHNV